MTFIGDRTYVQTKNTEICLTYFFRPEQQSVRCLGLRGTVTLIVNSTDNIIIYNPLVSSIGGSQSGEIINMDFDTSAMDANDVLLIVFDAISNLDSNLLLENIIEKLDNIQTLLEIITN